MEMEMLGELLTLGFKSHNEIVPSELLRFWYCILLQSAGRVIRAGVHTQRMGSVCEQKFYKYILFHIQ